MCECNCTYAQKTVGDGCRECNPQYWIDHLEGYVEELQEEKQALKQRLIDAVEILDKEMPSWIDRMPFDRFLELIENVFSEP